MGLEEKKTQHAGFAFDVNSSLIYIKVAREFAPALTLAAKRIRHQIRLHDDVLLLERACALLLPATPFAGAQAVASRISPLLTSVSCELQVYHGLTASLILQHLYEAGAQTLVRDSSPGPSAGPTKGPDTEAAERQVLSEMVPYLAFLTNYPSPRLLQIFPYELACRYQCVPVGSERRMLTLASSYALNRETLAQLRHATRREIFQVRCEINIINEVLHYWQQIQKTSSCTEAASKWARLVVAPDRQ